MIAIGLMSGTSLDGIDAALVAIQPRGDGYALELLDFATTPFDETLASALRAALPPHTGSIALTAELHRAIGDAFAAAAESLASNRAIAYIASHGQTVWHDGERSITLQLGDPFIIRERLNVTVCYDFRSADCAAGGQGAPLIPYVDALLFGSAHEDRLGINLGGIANATLLHRDGQIAAFDTGPGNMLLDAFVRSRTESALAFDRDGALAANGNVDAGLLDEMLADAYFAQAPPKSTGRERFGPHFLARHDGRLAQLRLEDGLATLAELTARTLVEAVDAAGFEPKRAIVAGGGAHNRHLMSRLQARLSPARVETSDAMGISVDAKEAMGFAVLGYETLRGRASNVPRATGATRAVPLGAIAPHQLYDLLNDVERECSSS